MSSEKARTIKNAGYLYIRTVITTLIGIYTARIIIQTLGIEDYGIYGVTGSVVAMLGFINASMSGATSRFITFELGRGDRQRLHDTFCTAMVIHIGIALLVLILAETVGLWFLCNKMVIPEEREQAAQGQKPFRQFSAPGMSPDHLSSRLRSTVRTFPSASSSGT